MTGQVLGGEEVYWQLYDSLAEVCDTPFDDREDAALFTSRVASMRRVRASRPYVITSSLRAFICGYNSQENADSDFNYPAAREPSDP